MGQYSSLPRNSLCNHTNMSEQFNLVNIDLCEKFGMA